MARAGFSMAILAVIVIALSNFIPLIGQIIVAPIAAAIIGAGAGWWASKLMGGGTAGRGAGAGAIAGLGALFGAVIGLGIYAAMFGNNADIQQGFNEALQQNPDAQLPDNVGVGTLLGAGGAVVGFCLGIVNLILSVLGGLIAGLIYGRNRGPAMASAPMTSYPTSATSLPQMTSQSQMDSGARVYPSETPQDRAARINPDQTPSDGGARIYPDQQRPE